MRNAECGVWIVEYEKQDKEIKGMRSKKWGVRNAECGL
jgi:hypothetical protein